MKVTRIATSKGLTPSKLHRLQKIARRLGAWRSEIWKEYGSIKGLIATALSQVSQRRGASLVLVNAAYTSQIDSRNGALLGRRRGDRFHCFDEVVLDADENAALNILARSQDPEIGLWAPYRKVRAILLERTEHFRLGLLNHDSSCST